MGQETGIAWTDHTFNPTWGCTKVSAGCKNCYADTFQRRYQFDVFGYNADGSRKPLRTFGDKHWNEPLKWNRDAGKAGVRRRVFCASMADVFDDHPDWLPHRARLWQVIRDTPHLDWQLLTKRPENIAAMLPDDWGQGYANVWLGTSVEDQDAAEKRIPTLLRVPAVVHFLSVEPLLGTVNLRDVFTFAFPRAERLDALTGRLSGILGDPAGRAPAQIGWVIVGGESGHGARRMDTAWVDKVLSDCTEANVPAFFKQTGSVLAREMRLAHSKGEDPREWPATWQRQDFPPQEAPHEP